MFANFLHVILVDAVTCYPGLWEEEPNGWFTEATGPLCSGQDYGGDMNDKWDYFYIHVRSHGPIIAHLVFDEGNEPEKDVQLLLYDRNYVLRDYEHCHPYLLEYPNASPGVYYLGVYNNLQEPEQPQYTIRVTYPAKVHEFSGLASPIPSGEGQH